MSSSLIPIKGISKAQERNLNTKCQIYDIAGLLAKGKTPAQRQTIATQLGLKKKEYVNIWVKQADLWRVEGMTEDLAYLLVLAGVRCVEDLAKIDVLTARNVLKAMASNNPFFNFGDREEKLIETVKVNAVRMNPGKLFQDSELYPEIPEEIRTLLESRLNGNSVDMSDEDEPRYLFGADYILEILDKKNESEILAEGLDSLQDICVTLPLPKYLCGRVSYRVKGKTESFDSVHVSNLMVEVDGINLRDSEHNRRARNQILSGYTDSEGKFIIRLPKDYTAKERICFTFSEGGYKQNFYIEYADIIRDAVVIKPEKAGDKRMTASELLTIFEVIDRLNGEITYLKADKNLLKVIRQLEEQCEQAYARIAEIDYRLTNSEPTGSDREMLNDEKLDLETDSAAKKILAFELKKRLRTETNTEDTDKAISSLSGKLNKLRGDRKLEIIKIFTKDPTKTDADCALSSLMSMIELAWYYGIEKGQKGFVLVKEIFEGYKDDYARALPSVKLMGEGEGAVWLPTDNAPGPSYSYSLLQRLVEPSVSPPGGDYVREGNRRKQKQRKKISEPIDISDFKLKFGEDALDASGNRQYSIMSSLGMGYTLNLHQAWVPDGFALGELLYSMILAPGEEQRLIVRENSLSYDISDLATGEDMNAQSQTRSQTDYIQAMYDFVMSEESQASSSSEYSNTSSSFGGGASGGWGGFVAGSFTGSYSKNSGSASSHASQSNQHNDASYAAQSFNQRFAAASFALSQSKRISIRSASSRERDSAATKIVANHNHSHAMTVQYWEVMRHYRLETSIDSVDLVLFVPLEPVRFLPSDQDYALDFYHPYQTDEEKNANLARGWLDRDEFKKRYKQLVMFYTPLRRALPSKYRAGLDLIQKFYSLPEFKTDSLSDPFEGSDYYIEIQGGFCPFDNFTATIYFNNGTASVKGMIVESQIPTGLTLFSLASINRGGYDGHMMPHTREEVKEAIMVARSDGQYSVRFRFELPYGCSPDNISYISVRNNINSTWEYTLSKMDRDMTDSERKAIERYEHWWYNYAKDTKDYSGDMEKIERIAEALPEWYLHPIATFTASELSSLGTLRINITEFSAVMGYHDEPYIWKDSEGKVHESTVSRPNGKQLAVGLTLTQGAVISNGTGLSGMSIANNAATIKRNTGCPRLSISDIQKMEATFQHIVSETLKYSKAVWNSLSTDELAVMLEKYTVDMAFSSYFDVKKGTKTDIPLLNCINVKRPMGFYGNCILFPFTYPEELAEQLGKSAAEIQDALYRYHATYFRSPSTVISVPTEGMIGEAVLSETNVSEKIDITRFWNWKDSPIDSMTLDQQYLNDNDYLDGKTTKDITPLNVQGAELITPTQTNDIISALTQRQMPTFDNITGLEQTATLLTSAIEKQTTDHTEVLTKLIELCKNTREEKKPGNGADGAGGAGGTGGAGSANKNDTIKNALSVAEELAVVEMLQKLTERMEALKSKQTEMAQNPDSGQNPKNTQNPDDAKEKNNAT